MMYVSDVAERWGVSIDAVRLYCRKNGVEFFKQMEPKTDGHGIVRRAYIRREDFDRLSVKRGQYNPDNSPQPGDVEGPWIPEGMVACRNGRVV